MRDKLTSNGMLCGILSLFWSWNWIIYQSPTPLTIQLGSVSIPMRFIVLVSFAVTGFIFFANFYVSRKRAKKTKQVLPAVMAVIVGTCIIVCDIVDGSFDGELAGWPFFFQAIAMGVGSAMLYMQVGSLFGFLGLDKLRMVTRSAIIALIICIPIQVIFYYTLGGVREGAMVLILIGITLVCSLVRSRPKEKGVPRNHERRSIPVKFAVTLLLVGVALGMMQGVFAQLMDSHTPLNPLSALGFFVAALMVFVMTFHERFNFNLMLYKTALPVLALGFTVVAMQANVFVAFVLCLAGYYAAQVVLWVLCVYLTMNSPDIAKWIFAFMGALLALGQALGLGSISTVLYGLDSQVSAFMAVVILLACLFMSTSQSVYESWGLVSPISQTADNALEAACCYIAEEKRLTDREREILPYLAQGRNRRIIADKLYLSENTIKTYISHIYAKLEVHTQQELIEYVQKINQASREDEEEEAWLQ